MGLTKGESSFIEAVSNRFDSAVPGNMEEYTPGSGTILPEQAVMYLTAAADVEFQPFESGITVTVPFAAGWVPVRVREVISITAGKVYIAY